MKDEMNQDEIRFFLTGGIALGGELPPCPAEWLSEKSWGELTRLGELPTFKGFIEHFRTKVSLYKPMYDSPNPHEYKIQEDYYLRLTTFQKMMVLRCIRPDKVIPAITNFVIEQLGQSFTEPPPFDLPNIYKDSSSVTPLIFVLSPGADPLNALVKFSELKKKNIETVSLGQG